MAAVLSRRKAPMQLQFTVKGLIYANAKIIL